MLMQIPEQGFNVTIEKYGRFEFVGAHPALDFTNTASERTRDVLTERLGSYADLLEWSRQAGVLDDGRAAQLGKLAAAQPQAAAAALRCAKELRETSFRLFGALIDGTEPAAADVDKLNRYARKTTRGGAVKWDGHAFVVDAPPPQSGLDEPLARITQGVVEVLTGEQSRYLSRCHDLECSWLFLDRSPAKRRRWCSMADCGNRAKARRHYAKVKAQRV